MNILGGLVISDDIFKNELDATLKQRKMKKKDRNEFIGFAMLADVHLRDTMLDDERLITNDFLKVCEDARNVPTEHSEQAAFIHWFRHTFPDVLIYAIPNGGNRSAREAASLVMEGVTAGVADLFIDDWNCYVEFKRVKGGVWSDEQEKFCDKVCANGKTYLLVWGLEDAKKKICSINKIINK